MTPYADPLDPNDLAAWERNVEEKYDDPLVHGAYADWLQDRGHDDEAEFRRSIGRWIEKGVGDGGPNLQSLRTNDAEADEFPVHLWSPDGFATRNFPEGIEGFPFFQVMQPGVVRDHHGDWIPGRPEPHHARWHDIHHTFSWRTRRDMEEAFRREFIRGRAGSRRGQGYSRYSRTDYEHHGFHPEKGYHKPLWAGDQAGGFLSGIARPYRTAQGWVWMPDESQDMWHGADAAGMWDRAFSLHSGLKGHAIDWRNLPPDEFEKHAQDLAEENVAGKPVNPHVVFQMTGGQEGEPMPEMDWRSTETTPEDFWAMSRYGRTDYADPSDFERAIDADPLDAINHLVYADWLDENGQPEEAAFRRAMGQWMQKTPPVVHRRAFHVPLVNPESPEGTYEHDFPPGVPAVGPPPRSWATNKGFALPPQVPRVLGRWSRGDVPPHGPSLGAVDADGGRRRALRWRNFRDMEQSFRDSFQPQNPQQMARYERRNSPAEIDYGGKKYRRGQFIPGTVLFQHTPRRAHERWRPERVEYDSQPADAPWPPLTPVPSAEDQDVQPAGALSQAIDAIGPLLDPQPALRRPKDINGREFDDEMLEWGRNDDQVAAELRGLVHPADADVLEEHLAEPSQDWVDLRHFQPAADPALQSADPRVMSKVKDVREIMGWSDPAYLHDYLGQLDPELRQRVVNFMGIQSAGVAPEVQPGGFDSPTPPPEADGPAFTPSPEKLRLAQLPVTAEEELGGGANASLLLTLDHAKEGVFKPTAGEVRLRKGVPVGTYYRREVAASDVADVLGMSDLVPPTTFRNHNGEDGSLQQFVEDAVIGEQIDEESRHDGPVDAARAAVFDYVIGHADRHDANWLVGEQSNFDSTGKLVLIDNGLSFPVTYHKGDYFNVEFWENAVNRNLPMPDVAPMRGKWPQLERVLLNAGIEPPAVELTRQRFEQVTSGNYPTVGDLPAFHRGGGRLTLRALYRRRG